MAVSVTGFAGDWHGNTSWARGGLEALAEHDCHIVYQVGDFGLWPGADGDNYLQAVHRTLDDLDQTLFVVLGNHEDYHRYAMMRLDGDGWRHLDSYPRFRFAPRGHVWTDRGVRMAAVGGATSVDRAFRIPGQSWWPEEEITAGDVEAVETHFAATGWDRVDVMLTHDAPAGLQRVGMTPQPGWMTPEILHDAWQGRLRLREAADIVAPRWLVHGHWHDWYRDAFDGVRPDGEGYTCETVGLTCDGMPRNLMVANMVPDVGLEPIVLLP